MTIRRTASATRALWLLALALALAACAQAPEELPTLPPPPADPLLGGRDASFEGPLPLDPLALARLGRGTVIRLAYSPDGGLLAVGTTLGVYVYDARALTDVFFVPTEFPIHGLGWSPDGATLAVGMTGSAELLLVDTATGEAETVPSGHAEDIGICGVSFSPDGTMLASSSYDDTVVMLDTQTREVALTVPGNGAVFNTTGFSPDGETLAAAQDRGTLALYNAQNGDLVRRMEGRELEGEIGSYGVAFTNDGARVASGGYGALNVWDARSGDTLLRVLDLPGHYQNVALLDSGKLLLAGNTLDDGGIWDVASGQQVLAMPATVVAATPAGDAYAAASNRRGLAVFDAATRLEQGQLGGHTGSYYAVIFAPGGNSVLASTISGEILRWNLETHERSVFAVGTMDSAVSTLALSPGETIVAAGQRDGQVALWDASNGRPLRTLAAQDSGVSGVSFSPDGKLLATSGEGDPAIHVWNVETGERVARLDTGQEGIYSLVFVDKNRLAAGGGDVIQIWNVNSGIRTGTLEGHENRVSALALSPDGSALLSGAYDGTGGLWDTKTGERVATLNAAGSIPGVAAFSPDGKRMALGLVDGRARVYDRETGEVLFTLAGHAMTAWGLAFSPDSKVLVSASYDGTLLLWDMDR